MGKRWEEVVKCREEVEKWGGGKLGKGGKELKRDGDESRRGREESRRGREEVGKVRLKWAKIGKVGRAWETVG
jgi:hypothetical protein